MLRKRTTKQQTAQSGSLPAPVGGLNARDSITAMPELDALVLDNWFPKNTEVVLRNGYSSHATFTGQAESLMAYNGVATSIFTAIVNGSTRGIHNATSAGALGAAVVGGASNTVQAVTSSRFDYVNMVTSGGRFLSAVNGADTPLQYDGTNWIASTMTGGTPSQFFTVASYAERLWYGVINTLTVRYLPVKSITGATVELDLRSVFTLGGSLSNIVTWSADTASALADYIAFVSTEGEVVAYSGTDPASASTWSRVAQFRIGKPVIRGNRGWCKFGAEAVIACADGLFPLTKAVLADRAGNIAAISDKIRNLVNRDVQLHGARFGWAVCLHPFGGKLILNVPTNENVASYQYVMNTQSPRRPWCRFTGWNAFCFESTKDTLYFGGNGVIAKADNGTADGASAINADALQAYNYFGVPGQQKQMTMARPILTLNGGVNLALDINVDFENRAPQFLTPISGSTGDPWGGIWSAAWTGASTVYRGWNSVRGVGFALAPRLKVQANEISLAWAGTDFVYNIGGVL